MEIQISGTSAGTGPLTPSTGAQFGSMTERPSRPHLSLIPVREKTSPHRFPRIIVRHT
ncbi:hypothetical protein RvY_11822 [Ramazzottius varieornatus]|uniref:Uncharacterized protein n=1 Tax=Ramazzottius varieornatus TaxID=947166 RepID=A0A1D1VJD6_RAMVA|nr:hypothetical protein RvY_11822 [Ramazzottius varieornatus]